MKWFAILFSILASSAVLADSSEKTEQQLVIPPYQGFRIELSLRDQKISNFFCDSKIPEAGDSIVWRVRVSEKNSSSIAVSGCFETMSK